jgi:large conductance mechanosensitive channel
MQRFVRHRSPAAACRFAPQGGIVPAAYLKNKQAYPQGGSRMASPTKQAFSLFEEFKNFAFKGNVIDLAVGVIIGGAFGKIVSSLVDNIIMPLVSVVLPGDASYKDWAIKIGEKTIPYGAFLGDIVSFLLLALALFVFIVKFLGWIMKSKAAEAVAPPPPTKDQELLMEIRDLLKQR